MLRIPVDIRKAWSLIWRRFDTQELEFYRAVAYWCKRYDELIIDRDRVYETRLFINTMKTLKIW